MKAVLDASAAIAVTMKREGYEPVYSAIGRCDTILAPELFQSESANALWKEVCFNKLKHERAAVLLEKALGMVDNFLPASENIVEAFFEAAHQRQSVYDMLYLTLARRNNAVLITLDKKLALCAAKLGITIYYEI